MAAYPDFTAAGGTKTKFGNWVWENEDGLEHRDNDLPAFISKECTVRSWFINGQRHRDHGPAVIATKYLDREVDYEEWYFHGKLHRLDGPAILGQDYDGNNHYYVDGVFFENGDDDAYKEACRRFRIEHGLLESGKLTKRAQTTSGSS